MHTISRDTPALFITAVAKNRLPVFRTDTIKIISCKALDEARKSGRFAIYAYVIMPDHLHVLTDSAIKPSKVLQFINGIISRRVIDHLKEHGHNASLRKLSRESGPADICTRFGNTTTMRYRFSVMACLCRR